MTKENKIELSDLHFNEKKNKSSLPDYAIARKNFNDNSTNALTSSIIHFINLKGGFAERISSTGRFVGTKKRIDFYSGEVKKEGTWIKGSGVKGTADISATINGLSVKIEVKFKKDSQSDEQKKYECSTINAGGIYFIAKNYDDFRDWYKEKFEK